MANRSKTKIFFDNSVVWVAVIVGIAAVVVTEKVNFVPETVLGSPLDNLEARDKKLTFGLFVTPDPAHNPINPPERFTGYHTALDLEILPGEEDQTVPVYAACDGKVLVAREASGYGGVIVQSCEIEKQKVTALYGHLDFRNFKVKVGDRIRRGEQITILGDQKSEESGFTRKHLHFGIHKGEQVVLLGYVQNQKDLEQYLDPFPLLTPKVSE